MATAAVCLARGIAVEAVAAGLTTFAGVVHRLELIATQDGVSYVNDSKATNVASTIVALRSYAGGVHLIAGGTGKNQDFSPLARLVSERCVAVHLIGEATPDLAQALAPTRVPLYDDGDLATALANARGTRAHRRGRPPEPGLRELRPVRELRSPRRTLPAARGERLMAGASAAAGGARSGGQRQASSASKPTRTPKPTAKRVPPPIEHRILMTAALCLLAFGAVMVYSASAPVGVLGGKSGTGTGEFVRYLVFGGAGLFAMHVLEKRGLTLLDRRLVTLMLAGSFVLLLLVLAPGFGVRVNGAKRWFAAGPLQFQPSEVMKLALILYVARYLAEHPKRMRSFKQAVAPIVLVMGPACLLIVVEPDLGTTLVVVFSITSLLIAAGMPMRYLGALALIGLGLVVLLVLAQPYQQARLLSFLHPWSAGRGAGYQAVQGQIALGSGGLLGVGLGQSVQKIYYLPEAQTDFILAVIGEELGVLGIFGVIFLYGMIAYAGLRTARRAADRYGKLLATGLTSLILCQGTLNIFVVLGLAPLTGVPLPFISYAPTNLCVMLVAVGLLLNISRPGARRLRVVDGSSGRRRARRDPDADRDRRRRDRGARRTGTGRRGRAAS